MHCAVIVFPGSNCDHDAYHVFQHILEVPVDFVWHKENDLKKFDAILERFNGKIYLTKDSMTSKKTLPIHLSPATNFDFI